MLTWLVMLPEGAIVGKYRVLHKLGEGGMGVVYVGQDEVLGRKAAIKVLLPAYAAHQEIIQRFFNEAVAVTQISDPGIVQVFEFGYHTDATSAVCAPYIIMELLDGEPMDRRLARIGRFPPADAVRLMRLICISVAAAHAKGIVHRDLKPDNIFIVLDPAVAGGERAKILDFGIAKLNCNDPARMMTRRGTMMGTPEYMSPEQFISAGDVDPRSDVYSIGCVLMTMLTGHPPFSGPNEFALMDAHHRAPPPYAAARVPGLPEILDQILQCCLAKLPLGRFQTMAELVQALSQAEQRLQPPVPGAMQAVAPAPGAAFALAPAAPRPPAPTPPPSVPPARDVARTTKMDKELESIRALLDRIEPTPSSERRLRDLMTSCPNEPRVYEYLGEYYNRCQRYAEAIDVFQRGLETNPHHALLYWRLGLTLQRTGHKLDAKRHLEQAVQLGLDAGLKSKAMMLIEGLGK